MLLLLEMEGGQVTSDGSLSAVVPLPTYLSVKVSSILGCFLVCTINCTRACVVIGL